MPVVWAGLELNYIVQADLELGVILLLHPPECEPLCPLGLHSGNDRPVRCSLLCLRILKIAFVDDG